MASLESSYKVRLLNVAIIGAILAAVEVAAAAGLSHSLKDSVSKRMANNIWSLILTIAFATFWGAVQISKLGKGNHPVYGKPGFRREHLLAWALSVVLFLCVEVYLIATYGTVNPFFH